MPRVMEYQIKPGLNGPGCVGRVQCRMTLMQRWIKNVFKTDLLANKHNGLRDTKNQLHLVKSIYSFFCPLRGHVTCVTWVTWVTTGMWCVIMRFTVIKSFFKRGYLNGFIIGNDFKIYPIHYCSRGIQFMLNISCFAFLNVFAILLNVYICLCLSCLFISNTDVSCIFGISPLLIWLLHVLSYLVSSNLIHCLLFTKVIEQPSQ